MPTGGYVFTDLAHLDRVISNLVSIRDAILQNSGYLEQAVQPVQPPADDTPSRRQTTAYIDCIFRAIDHHRALARFAAAHVDRMTASKEQYAVTEEDNTQRFPGHR